MTVSNSRLAYGDCFDLLDKAIADNKGIRVRFDEWKQANYYRMRLHTARAIDRKDNARTFTEDQPMHGRSIYDTIVGRIKEDGDGFFWLYLEKVENNIDGPVESLSELGDEA